MNDLIIIPQVGDMSEAEAASDASDASGLRRAQRQNLETVC